MKLRSSFLLPILFQLSNCLHCRCISPFFIFCKRSADTFSLTGLYCLNTATKISVQNPVCRIEYLKQVPQLRTASGPGAVCLNRYLNPIFRNSVNLLCSYGSELSRKEKSRASLQKRQPETLKRFHRKLRANQF